MRYSGEHKQATRQRIIAAAGRRFKLGGIDGSGIAAVMKDADLTNGAFYAHFDSKEDLVANVLADQLHTQCESLGALPAGRAGVEAFVRAYLSARHRDHPDQGCPSAALLDEVGRCTEAAKQAYTEGTLAIVDALAARLAPDDPHSARVQVAAAFAAMVGTLQLSRALADPALAHDVLEQGVRNVLALLCIETHDD